MAPRNIVGSVIRRKRVEAGLSQEGLSAKIQILGWDLSRGGLSKIEAQLRRVNDAELVLLSKVLKCEIGDLYPDETTEILEVLRQGQA